MMEATWIKKDAETLKELLAPDYLFSFPSNSSNPVSIEELKLIVLSVSCFIHPVLFFQLLGWLTQEVR